MRFWCTCLAWGFLLGAADVASADSSVIVLGLRSVEGDDAAAFGLSSALRDAASEVPGWEVRTQSVTLGQMSLAHGCEEVDANCLADIARALDVDLVIYGTVRRSSARDDFKYVARLNLFDAVSGAIERDATMSFAQSLQDASMLRPVADKLVAQLAPEQAIPTLTIETNVAGAEVFLDGELMGQVQDDSYVLRDLSPGEHTVEVTALGYAPFEERVVLQSGQPATVSATLVSASGEGEGDQTADATDAAGDTDGIPMWLTGTMFGVGAAGLAATVVSWLVIEGVAKDETYRAYSATIEALGTFDDVCVAAEQGVEPDAGAAEARDLCSRADTFEILQWVFLGIGAAGVITGTTLLIIDENSMGGDIARGRIAPNLSVRPDVSRERAGVAATWRF